MQTFIEFREAAPGQDELQESMSLVRKGAAVAFTAQSRTHAKNAQASFQQSLTALKSSKGKSTPERLEAVSDALQGVLEGLIEITKQLNQTTAVSASSALLNERTDKEILSLLKQRKTKVRRRRR